MVGSTKSYGAGDEDVCLVKTDETGTIEWTRTYGGNKGDFGESVRQTADSGYVIYGQRWGGSNPAYMIKTDSLGDTLWTRSHKKGTASVGVEAIQTTDSGYIMVGEYFINFGYRVCLTKTTANGDTIWTKSISFGSQSTDARSIVETFDGGYMLMSIYSGVVYFTKLNGSGVLEWSKAVWSPNNYSFGYLTQTADSGFVAVTADQGSQSIPGLSLFKIDSLGVVRWSYIIGGVNGDEPYQMQEDNEGNLIIVGRTENYGAANQDILLVKTSKDGVLLWGKRYGGINSDVGCSVSVTDDGGYIIAGETQSIIWGQKKMYLIKTDNNGNSGYCNEYTFTAAVYNQPLSDVSTTPLLFSGFTSYQTAFTYDTVTVQDSVLCSSCFTHQLSFLEPSCYETTDGIITHDLYGGTAPYTFSWSTGDSTQNPGYVGIATHSITVVDSAGCSGTAVVNVTGPALNQKWLVEGICYTDSFFVQGAYQDSAGVYYDTLVASNGCDSVLRTTLYIVPAFIDSNTYVICDGDSILLGGAYQTTAGVYIDTLLSVMPCDSVVVTTLTVDTVFISSDSAQICFGDSIYLGGAYQNLAGVYIDTLTSLEGCDSIATTVLSYVSFFTYTADYSVCDGDSILLESSYESVAGTYVDTFVAANGCDSVILSSLSVVPLYNIATTITICGNDSVLLEGTYQSTSGTYIDTLASQGGCDSVVVSTLVVDPAYSVQVLAAVCNGDSIFLAGAYQTVLGNYVDIFSTSTGCDSVITTALSTSGYNLSSSIVICSDDSILLEGSYQFSAGTYVDSLLSVEGCDSIHSTVLSINPTYAISDSAISICDGDSSLIYGTYRTTSGIYFDSLSTVEGCDSVRTTSLTLDQVPVVSFTGLDTVYCSTVAGVTMLGTPTGGTFSGTGAVAGDQFFPATGVNSYTVTYSYTDSLGCSNSASQSVSVVQCTGMMEEHGISQVKIYPNPNTGEFTIRLRTESVQNFEFKVFNNLGELISSDKVVLSKGLYERQVDLQERAAGVYNIQIIYEGEAINRKVVIK